MKSLKERIQHFYDATTPLWEATWGEHMHHGHYGADGTQQKDHYQAQLDMIEELLRWGEVAKAERILDIGCGIGGSSLYLASSFDAHVTGITLSPVQADRARARARETGLEHRSHFRVADALEPPFQPGSFDLAWSLESGEHMPDKRRFLRAAAQMLRPGGRFLMATWCHRPEPPELTTPEQLLLLDIYTAYHLPWITSNPEYARLAIEEGFTAVEIADWTAAVTPFWPAVVRSALKPAGIGGLLRAGWPAISGALSMRLMIRGYRSGLLRFGVLKATKP